jgi:hypothetical protein
MHLVYQVVKVSSLQESLLESYTELWGKELNRFWERIS